MVLGLCGQDARIFQFLFSLFLTLLFGLFYVGLVGKL